MAVAKAPLVEQLEKWASHITEIPTFLRSMIVSLPGQEGILAPTTLYCYSATSWYKMMAEDEHLDVIHIADVHRIDDPSPVQSIMSLSA